MSNLANVRVYQRAHALAPSNSQLQASVATVEIVEAWYCAPLAMKLARCAYFIVHFNALANIVNKF